MLFGYQEGKSEEGKGTSNSIFFVGHHFLFVPKTTKKGERKGGGRNLNRSVVGRRKKKETLSRRPLRNSSTP